VGDKEKGRRAGREGGREREPGHFSFLLKGKGTLPQLLVVGSLFSSHLLHIKQTKK
jgi:hypothetical protein